VVLTPTSAALANSTDLLEATATLDATVHNATILGRLRNHFSDRPQFRPNSQRPLLRPAKVTGSVRGVRFSSKGMSSGPPDTAHSLAIGGQCRKSAEGHHPHVPHLWAGFTLRIPNTP